MRYELLTAGKEKITVFWIVTPCSFVGRGSTILSTKLHGLTSLKKHFIVDHSYDIYSKSVQETHGLLNLTFDRFFLCVCVFVSLATCTSWHAYYPFLFFLPYFLRSSGMCSCPPPPKSARGCCGSLCRHFVSRAFMVTPLCFCNQYDVAAVCDIYLIVHFVP